jgi:hypothetical protein
MDLFYKVVLTVAIIALIIVLIVVGVAVSNSSKTKVFPPTALKCPDYWTYDNTNGCTPGTINIGDNNLTSPVNFDDTAFRNDSTYVGLSETCARKKWADTNGIIWDGISNYNSC